MAKLTHQRIEDLEDTVADLEAQIEELRAIIISIGFTEYAHNRINTAAIEALRGSND